MAPKKLWFNLHYDGKLVKNFCLKNVYVKSVCTVKDGPPIYFKAEDQTIAKHSILKNFVKDNSIKFGRCKKIEVTFKSTKEYEVYHDKSTSRLWFNGKHLTGTTVQKNTSKPETRKSAKKSSEKVSKATSTPKKKVQFSPSEYAASRQRKSDVLPSTSKAAETFSLPKHMENHGFLKFKLQKMDMYRFLNTYETGCKKLKLDDEDMIAMFMFYLDTGLKKEFMELQIYKPSAIWEEFRSNWAEKYHDQTYQYCWKYLSSTFSQGLLSEFARKKSKVI